MPLRDHFHYPTNRRARWDAIHGVWPASITAALNRILPPRYAAGPCIYVGSLLEIDVATFETDEENEPVSTTESGRVATLAWAPPAPSLTVPADWSAVDTYEIRVYDTKEERELVAAIELVRPSNKDRPTTRELFTAKCAGLLQAGVSVTIIDVVTNREANLYAELLEAIGQADPAITAPPQPIYAVACRARAAQRGQALETWYYPLRVGDPLPILPIWLTDRLAVPLELEPIYTETLHALRIR
ncbi:MAG: DUF4058 family protein [Bacteroidales bacterium]|nr:DUF4058 family protein [Bacteroidales bacterium]